MPCVYIKCLEFNRIYLSIYKTYFYAVIQFTN